MGLWIPMISHLTGRVAVDKGPLRGISQTPCIIRRCTRKEHSTYLFINTSFFDVIPKRLQPFVVNKTAKKQISSFHHRSHLLSVLEVIIPSAIARLFIHPENTCLRVPCKQTTTSRNCTRKTTPRYVPGVTGSRSSDRLRWPANSCISRLD